MAITAKDMPIFGPSGEEKRFTLRMDKVLFEQISHVAKLNRRSVAKEIEYAVALYLESLIENESNRLM